MTACVPNTSSRLGSCEETQRQGGQEGLSRDAMPQADGLLAHAGHLRKVGTHSSGEEPGPGSQARVQAFSSGPLTVSSEKRCWGNLRYGGSQRESHSCTWQGAVFQSRTKPANGDATHPWELPGLSGSHWDFLPFPSKGGHSLGTGVHALQARLRESSGASWCCRAVGPGEWRRHQGLQHWLAPLVAPAMCFPLAVHTPGRGSRRAPLTCLGLVSALPAPPLRSEEWATEDGGAPGRGVWKWGEKTAL